MYFRLFKKIIPPNPMPSDADANRSEKNAEEKRGCTYDEKPNQNGIGEGGTEGAAFAALDHTLS